MKNRDYDKTKMKSENRKVNFRQFSIFSFQLSILAACFFLLSCEEEMEFTNEISQPKLVLNSILIPDSLVSVHLSESGFFLIDPDNFKSVEDADVFVYRNDVQVEKLRYTGNGIYKTEVFTPSAGDMIKITASNSKYGEITAETVVVEMVPIESVSASNFREERYFFGSSYEMMDGRITNRIYTYRISEHFDLNIRFFDPADEDNFYRVVVHEISYYDDGSIIYIPVPFYTNEALAGTVNEWGSFRDREGGDGYNEFADGVLNGKENSLKIPVVYNIRYQEVDGEGNIISEHATYDEIEDTKRIRSEVRAELQSISRDYYLYLKSRYESESASSFGGLFSEPVQVYNNVNNGLGILGSSSSSVKIEEIRDKKRRNKKHE